MFKVTVERRGICVKGVIERSMRKLIPQAMSNALTRWRDGTMPGHFQTGAAQKYGYEKRAPAYQKRKNRMRLPPLVYSGAARNQILADRRPPTGTRRKITLRMQAPRYFFMRFKRKKMGGQWGHTMADEVAKILQTEERELLKQGEVELTTLLNNDPSFEKVIFHG